MWEPAPVNVPAAAETPANETASEGPSGFAAVSLGLCRNACCGAPYAAASAIDFSAGASPPPKRSIFLVTDGGSVRAPFVPVATLPSLVGSDSRYCRTDGDCGG